MGLAFSPDGKTLASSSPDSKIRFWDSKRPIRKEWDKVNAIRYRERSAELQEGQAERYRDSRQLEKAAAQYNTAGNAWNSLAKESPQEPSFRIRVINCRAVCHDVLEFSVRVVDSPCISVA